MWLALVCLPAGAQVYTYEDANGHRVYTDQPRHGAKPVKLAPGNTMAPSPVPTQPTAKPHAAPVRVMHYNLLRILAPVPDGSISHAGGEVVVTVSSDPALLPGDRFELVLDDQPAAAPSSSPVIMLSNVDRGEHRLAVRIIDQQGLVIEQTAAQVFYLQRMSLAQKRRVRPCEDDDYGVRPECPLSLKPTDD
ncbi:DUF4124 domain-containing protein [Pseudomonas sp. C2L12B]|uniref:DUF4124 domain-containing protein n=1 Tax=Pseudomonas typographi TaxID=2715964 RepID=A0ABR7Z892_9PSED|nr:DUF4124 domain-containing protein [Pseudomonas typographi]MBD1551875.1 DUF4124 domain-containing protein [Pseudomonas typographi]MBD1587679.1 DUF4124 domain-containing protein [Pseudomonas typographi]MBD1601578.1 DUF4124 domain-containing protein [Pseudomonas typographi]